MERPAPASATASRVRLAELLGALSLGIDLGFGQPMEHVLRQCLIAIRIAEQRGLDEPTRAAVYYTSLIINVGCHSDAHEQAKWFGDDIAIKAAKYRRGIRGRGQLEGMKLLGAGRRPLHRFRLGLEFVIAGHREMDLGVHAKVARLLAEKLGLSATVIEAVMAAYECWDGRGWPHKIAGDAIPIAARIALLAEYVEVAHRMHGVDTAMKHCRRFRGREFDPSLVDLVSARAHDIFDGIDRAQTWDAVIDAEPALRAALTDSEIDAALVAIASFVDLKSPYFLGHAENVAELAAAAGRALRLPEADVSLLRRAGLVHGFGRLGVSNAIWDKRGPLGAGEQERVRMHPYLTERMLQQSRGLAPIGALASQYCERIDGSGYPRKLSGSALSVTARVLGAAAAYQSMCEPRPHRAPRPAADAADQLRREVRAGRLDGAAVDAVLSAAGHRVSRRPERLAGLTPRELDVLRFVVQGMTTKEIAENLGITPKTAGNHIEHIYGKISARNRAEAGLFAVQHGLFLA